MARKPCMECHRRPPYGARRRCLTCWLRHEPIGDQVREARRRLAMVPEELRVKRSKKIEALAPAGSSWCAGCQSFRDLEDFRKSATQCRACASAKTHASMIEKTYGITGDDYERLLALQGGGCAVCGARPRSKRHAVDHDHKTGAVRGLLCSRHNHDALGALADSIAMVSALWHYLNTPPASGAWLPLDRQPTLMAVKSAVRSVDASASRWDIVTSPEALKPKRAAAKRAEKEECARPHAAPVGSIPIPGTEGLWRIWAGPDGDPPF